MARVTVDEVRSIISTKADDNTIYQYIASAQALMDLLIGQGLTAMQMKEIERWLTAHLIASTRDRQAREEGAGGAYIKYTGLSYTGLRGTTYGQQAIVLDTSGTLATIAGKSVKFKAIEQ